MTHIWHRALFQTCCLLLSVTNVLSTIPTYTIENGCNKTVKLGEYQFAGKIDFIYKPAHHASNFSCDIQIETTSNSLIHYYSDRYIQPTYCSPQMCKCDPQVVFTNGTVAKKYCFSYLMPKISGVYANKLTVHFQSNQHKRYTFKLLFYTSHTGYCDSDESICANDTCLHNSIASDVDEFSEGCTTSQKSTNVYHFSEPKYSNGFSHVWLYICTTAFPILFLFIFFYICCCCCCKKKSLQNDECQSMSQNQAPARNVAVMNRNRRHTSRCVQMIFSVEVPSSMRNVISNEVYFDMNATADDRSRMDPPTYNSLFTSSEPQCHTNVDLPPTYHQVILNQEDYKVSCTDHQTIPAQN